MPINDIGRENNQSFLEFYRDDPSRIILFVGAGLSMPLFPSWSVFLRELVNYCSSKGRLPYTKRELIRKINKGEDYLDMGL